MVEALVEWAEFINEHGTDAAIARADTAQGRARGAPRTATTLLDEQGDDANHAAEKIVEIRKTVGRTEPPIGSRMTPNDHPLFEFDPSPDAVINPSIHRPPLGFPDRAVMCWFGDVVRERTVEHRRRSTTCPFEHGDHAICVIAAPRRRGRARQPGRRRAGGGHVARGR